MIYVRINGGIGNQLLRYAAARALAERNKSEVVIDLSWYRIKQTPPRVFVLNHLNTVGRFATIREKLGLNQARKAPGKIAQATRLLPMLLPNVVHVYEKDLPFKTWIRDMQGDIYLDSDCYSEKYFRDIEIILRKELTLRAPSNFFINTKKEMDACNSVALHIRRGDYVWNPKVNNGTLPLEYYQRSAEFIAQHVEHPQFFIFSDDLPWVKENLKLPFPMRFISHPTEAREWEEMFLISACKHQIIANSSFSWWGAWLNANTQKIVCAPKVWFADPSKDTSDIIPESWLQF